MMKRALQNRIAKYAMQVVFVFFLLLVPATVVQQNVSGENNAGQNISFAALVAHAADPVPTGPADDTIWNKIGVTILEVGSYVAWLGGKLLNWTFNELVLQMGGRVNTSEIGGNINILWKVIRDICNLAFIFGFIYVGFSAIISSLNHGTKTMLAQIIIGAILINFSLYITKVVIDFSNFTAVQIYNNITIDHVNDDNQLNISDGFAHTIGLQTAYGKVDPNTLGKVAGDGGFWFYFIATIFFLVLGFVLAAGGILIAIRFIALLMIMIFSPILFAATVFPKTAEHASDLWHKLFSYAFFAPVYLILLLISLMILTGFTKAIVGANKDLATGFTTSSDAGSFGIVGVFVIAILFLIFALHAAQSMGVVGGKLAVKIGGDIKNRGQKILTNSAVGTARLAGTAAGGATFGLAARGGRALVGKRAYEYGDSDKAKDRAARKGIEGWAHRQILNATQKVGDASFDARNIGGVGKAVGIGEGKKGGWGTRMKEVENEEMKVAKQLGEVDDDDILVQGRKKEVEGLEKRIREERDRSRTAGSADEKAAAAANVRTLEDDLKKAQEKYQQEKQRRILGSTYASSEEKNADLIEVTKQLEDRDKNLKLLWGDYQAINKDASDAERQAVLDRIKNAQEIIDGMKKQQAAIKFQISTGPGYASVLKHSDWKSSWLAGRMITHDKEAGKKMEKAYMKKVKKTKEDKKHDEILEASKKEDKGH